MRVIHGSLYLLLAFSFICQNPQGHAQAQYASPTSQPKWNVELKTYGWSPPKAESNRSFFRDFTLAKLDALDGNTRILFIGNDTLAIYHTKREGNDWHTATRQLEAFFIGAKDGKLLSRKTWPTGSRGSESDLRDSEGRMLPLSRGRFLVFANHTMLIYGSNLEQFGQKKLEPSTSDDLWSAQTVAGGDKIFLRHQSASDQQTTYYWLSTDTLLPLSQMAGLHELSFSVVATAGDDFVLMALGWAGPGVTTGIGKMEPDGTKKIICSEQICREDGITEMVSPRCLAISGRRGISALDPQKGLLWSELIPAASNPNDFQFGDIRHAISGNRFAVWVTAYRKTSFDSVEVHSPPTLLVYDCEGSRHLPSLKMKSVNGDFDFALSPDGSKLAVFDGARVKLYAVDPL